MGDRELCSHGGAEPVKYYTVNEIFYSLQGEGVRSGAPSIFVRFSGCNLECSVEPGPKSPGGFDCDTEFVSGRKMTGAEILSECKRIGNGCSWIILTGGEPGLQVDSDLVEELKHDGGYSLAIETNGSVDLAGLDIDWVTVSPKVAEHAIRQKFADEVKYVRGYGQAIPKTVVEAEHKLISPAFAGQQVDNETLAWCIQLVKENPEWRLSVQSHKLWRVR